MADFDTAMTKAQELMSLDGVVGVGTGELDGKECIVVLVAAAREDVEARLPREIDGFPVRIEESGPIVAGDAA